MQHPTRPIRRPWAACRHTTRWFVTAAFAALAIAGVGPALAQTLTLHQQFARDIYVELVEINTVTATGDTARAADAMAARLRAAGIDDVQVFKRWQGCAALARASQSCSWRILTWSRPSPPTGRSILSS
jgi:hypothetical protein